MYKEVTLLLFAHWVGDYVLQTNEMAYYKGRSLRWLTIHVAVYSIPIGAAAFILFRPGVILQFCDINFALHWATDFITSRLAYHYKETPRIYYPIIGFDQFIHGACLILTANYVHSLTGSFQFY
jgi:hypothetical protein